MLSDSHNVVPVHDSVVSLEDNLMAAEQASALKETHADFKKMDAISAWNSVLLHVNEILLPGFARHHIGRMAKSVASGLRVEVQTAWGSHIPSTIILRLQIRDGDDIDDFAVITLPMGQTKLPLHADHFSALDESLMKNMFPDPRTDHIGVAHSRFRDQDLEYFKTFEHTAEISSFIKYTAATISRVTAVVEVHELNITYPSKFWGRIQVLPNSLQRIAKNIKSLFDSMNPEEQISFNITFPCNLSWGEDWHLFFTDERKVNPEILDISSLCNGQIEDLDYSQMLAGREEYGMIGTHSPTAYLMAVNLKSVRDFLPDVGTKVNVYLGDVAQNGYTLPKPLFAERHIIQIGLKIKTNLYMADYNAQQTVRRKFRGRLQDEERLATELYFRMAAVELAPFLPMPAKDDLQHKEALKAAQYLQMRPDEDDEVHCLRLIDWLRTALRVAPKTRYHEPYSGRRLDLPPGVSADVALFHLEVPRQRDWPRDLKNPPMMIDIPNTTPPADLQQFLVNAFASQEDVVRAEIRYSLDTERYKERSRAAFHKDNHKPDSVGDDWWKSMVRFLDLSKTDQADLPQMQLDSDAATRNHANSAMGEEVAKLAMKSAMS
ncbi:hypothetical protein V8C35DRAFT_329366 [Trichoderma chlorosporum]